MTWETLAVLVLCTLIALWLRVHNLATMPPGIHGDEANFALEVQRILREGWIGIWTIVNFGAGTGHLYYAAPFFLLGGPTIEMLRLSVATLGTAMVPAAFVLVRPLFGPRIALLAAALLACSVWFVIQSRLGLDPIPSLFMYILAMALLLNGLRSDRWWLAAVAGAVFGGGLYAYKAYLLYYLVSVAVVAGLLVVHRRWRRRPHLYGFLGAALAVGAPILFHYLTTINLFQAAASYTLFDPAFTLAANAARLQRVGEVLGYIHRPMSVDQAGGVPIFSSVPVRTVFWLGLATTCLCLNRRSHQLLLLGWLIALVPVVLVPGSETRRYLLGIFFLLVMVAVGLDALIRIVVHGATRTAWPHARRLAHGAAILAVTAFVALYAFQEYRGLIGWTTSAPARWFFNYESTAALAHLQTLDVLGEDFELRLYSARHGSLFSLVRWMLPQVRGVDGSTEFGGDGTATSGGAVEGATVFLVLDRYLAEEGLMADMEATYPHGQWHLLTRDDGVQVFAAYILVPP